MSIVQSIPDELRQAIGEATPPISAPVESDQQYVIIAGWKDFFHGFLVEACDELCGTVDELSDIFHDPCTALQDFLAHSRPSRKKSD